MLSSDASLLCRVRDYWCALPLVHAGETMRPLPIEPLAGMPLFVRGLSVIRGVPTPVVDAGVLLGASDLTEGGRFVTIRTGDRRVALAVDAVVGVRELPGGLGDLPPLVREASAEIISAVGALDAELLIVLGAARLLPEAVWRMLSEREASP